MTCPNTTPLSVCIPQEGRENTVFVTPVEETSAQKKVRIYEEMLMARDRTAVELRGLQTLLDEKKRALAAASSQIAEYWTS